MLVVFSRVGLLHSVILGKHAVHHIKLIVTSNGTLLPVWLPGWGRWDAPQPALQAFELDRCDLKRLWLDVSVTQVKFFNRKQ